MCYAPLISDSGMSRSVRCAPRLDGMLIMSFLPTVPRFWAALQLCSRSAAAGGTRLFIGPDGFSQPSRATWRPGASLAALQPSLQLLDRETEPWTIVASCGSSSPCSTAARSQVLSGTGCLGGLGAGPPLQEYQSNYYSRFPNGCYLSYHSSGIT